MASGGIVGGSVEISGGVANQGSQRVPAILHPLEVVENPPNASLGHLEDDTGVVCSTGCRAIEIAGRIPGRCAGKAKSSTRLSIAFWTCKGIENGFIAGGAHLEENAAARLISSDGGGSIKIARRVPINQVRMVSSGARVEGIKDGEVTGLAYSEGRAVSESTPADRRTVEGGPSHEVEVSGWAKAILFGEVVEDGLLSGRVYCKDRSASRVATAGLVAAKVSRTV